MLSAFNAAIERICSNLSHAIARNENKFHKLRVNHAIFVDLMKNFTQYEKINYIGCRGRSAL